MKKLFLMIAVLCTCACGEKEKHDLVNPGDIVYFTEIPVFPDGEEAVSVGSITEKTIQTSTTDSWEWWVIRDIYIALHYLPRQQVNVLVDESRSTAKEGVDFKLTGTNILFDDREHATSIVRLDILTGKLTGPKTLVLKLDYQEEEFCPLESRTKNVLTITLE